MMLSQYRVYRSDLRANRGKVFYLFGDNLLHVGYGGQAKEMRDEPNAIGVPTKRRGSMEPDAFFTDAEFATNAEAIMEPIFEAARRIEQGYVVVVPQDGLGTGLSQLPERAPKTNMFLLDCLSALYKIGPNVTLAEAFTPVIRKYGVDLSCP